jgi:hypothetical protein
MTDNRTTELREKLTERGIEWRSGLEGVTFVGDWCFVEYDNGRLAATCEPVLTPEQAIAATLGRPKVKKVRGMTYDEHGGEVYFLACSGCGDWVDGDLDCIGDADGPNFCHNCGGEFDGPLMCKVCGELADMEFGDMCAECYWHEGEGNDER